MFENWSKKHAHDYDGTELSQITEKRKQQIELNECLKSGLVISLSDSQMLKTIRDITGQKVDRDQLEEWYKERDWIKKKKNSKQNKIRIQQLQQNIYDMMYIPQYITVVMESAKDYERMYTKGFMFNGKKYVRLSCSASQARVSTIVFTEESIKDEIKRRLDCGRDMNHPMAPSKYNAYFGLYSSAIRTVRKPRFCIVPDFEEEMEHEVDYIIETDKDSDDIIERRTVTGTENRFDGSGLISPHMAELWGQDLGEDYTPCNFCLRYTFTKGMVNTFDFVEWCHEKNNDNYIIKDIWGNDIDLRNIDVILSAGQVKLWDSWESQEEFERLSDENGIVFGITKYSPKKDKSVLMTNYQYIQTLRMNDDDVKELCKDTIDYIKGVSYDNIYYTLLFLLGETNNPTEIKRFLESSDNYWLKTLILNHNLLNDKYTKEKIRDMIVRRIELACLGRLIVRGCYQCICPDPYAYMEWICYRGEKPVNGLLKAGEAYCEYWNNISESTGIQIDKVDAMRSPLTHFSEHGIDNLVCNDEMKKWYKYCYSGYINNTHDEFTYVHAGSDWDYDIISSTNCKQFVNGKYDDTRVVTYNVKKPKKKLFTEDDLFITDCFSFGTLIGSITNTASTVCALMANFSEDSKEYKILKDRLAAACGAQSRQIDKTKIGEKVKGLGTIMTTWQKKTEEDTEEEKQKKDFYNSIIADKKPYFFKYKYKALNKQLNEYNKKYDKACITHYKKTLKEILAMSQEEIEKSGYPGIKNTVEAYWKKYPVLDSDCVMNKVCHYIEEVDFEIKKKVRSDHDFDYHLLQTRGFVVNRVIYEQIKEEVEATFKKWNSKLKDSEINRVGRIAEQDMETKVLDRDLEVSELKRRLLLICSNEEMLTNHLIYLFYEDRRGLSKATLWNLVGKQIYENVKAKTDSFYFPVKNDTGSLSFLYENYEIQKINLNEIEEDVIYNI